MTRISGTQFELNEDRKETQRPVDVIKKENKQRLVSVVCTTKSICLLIFSRLLFFIAWNRTPILGKWCNVRFEKRINYLFSRFWVNYALCAQSLHNDQKSQMQLTYFLRALSHTIMHKSVWRCQCTWEKHTHDSFDLHLQLLLLIGLSGYFGWTKMVNNSSRNECAFDKLWFGHSPLVIYTATLTYLWSI